jgi:FixJ family two-component response regulator
MGDARATVFVVDDDASMRGALGNLINSVGLEVQLYASPQEFLNASRPDVPGCLVLDMRLPGMSGLAFQQELARLGFPLPIIFITGYADVPTSVRAMKAGAVEFLTKPFRDQDLLDAIQAAIERDRARRLANKQIAAELGLSEVTVKVHRGQVMRKMRAKSLPELVRMADRLAAHGTRA